MGGRRDPELPRAQRPSHPQLEQDFMSEVTEDTIAVRESSAGEDGAPAGSIGPSGSSPDKDSVGAGQHGRTKREKAKCQVSTFVSQVHEGTGCPCRLCNSRGRADGSLFPVCPALAGLRGGFEFLSILLPGSLLFLGILLRSIV